MVGLIASTNPIPPPELPSAAATTSFGAMLVWMMLVLIIVVGGMILLSRFLQRFPGLKGRRGENLVLHESMSLTPKAAVHIVSADGERMLIGTNDGAITHLTHLIPRDEGDEP